MRLNLLVFLLLRVVLMAMNTAIYCLINEDDSLFIGENDWYSTFLLCYSIVAGVSNTFFVAPVSLCVLYCIYIVFVIRVIVIPTNITEETMEWLIKDEKRFIGGMVFCYVISIIYEVCKNLWPTSIPIKIYTLSLLVFWITSLLILTVYIIW